MGGGIINEINSQRNYFNEDEQDEKNEDEQHKKEGSNGKEKDYLNKTERKSRNKSQSFNIFNIVNKLRFFNYVFFQVQFPSINLIINLALKYFF